VYEWISSLINHFDVVMLIIWSLDGLSVYRGHTLKICRSQKTALETESAFRL
jgi:hypothetical protein